MLKRIRKRLAGNTEQGFTLIELLVVIIIIGILLAIAVPSYLSFKGRAETSSAKANLRAALPSAEAYYADKGSYTGMDFDALKDIDSGLSANVTVVSADDTSYCLTDSEGSATWSVEGPGATYHESDDCT